jgi:hypothetical protein
VWFTCRHECMQHGAASQCDARESGQWYLARTAEGFSAVVASSRQYSMVVTERGNKSNEEDLIFIDPTWLCSRIVRRAVASKALRVLTYHAKTDTSRSVCTRQRPCRLLYHAYIWTTNSQRPHILRNRSKRERPRSHPDKAASRPFSIHTWLPSRGKRKYPRARPCCPPSKRICTWVRSSVAAQGTGTFYGRVACRFCLVMQRTLSGRLKHWSCRAKKPEWRIRISRAYIQSRAQQRRYRTVIASDAEAVS